MICLVTMYRLHFEFLRLQRQLRCHMIWGKILYSNLQMSRPWYHCDIHIHSIQNCVWVSRLLRYYAKVCPELCDIATLSIV